jgi:hypothetical protein
MRRAECGAVYTAPMNATLSAARRGHGALILVVLIAMAIMLYLMFGSGGGGKSYMQQMSTTRQNAKATVQDINTQQLSILIAQYRVDNGKLPAKGADLENDVALRDPWGNAMTFTFEDERGRTKVTYRSRGPDGEANTEDDVTKSETLPF